MSFTHKTATKPHPLMYTFRSYAQIFAYVMLYAVSQLDQSLFTGSRAACKMMRKLTQGVDFTNILRSAFTRADPKSTKKYNSLTVLFYHFGICALKSFA